MFKCNELFKQLYNIPSFQIEWIDKKTIFFHQSMLTAEIDESVIPYPNNMYQYHPKKIDLNQMTIQKSTGNPSQQYSLFTIQNKKLGHMFNFSLPASLTCPGQTEWCRINCYANKGRFMYIKSYQKYLRNFYKSKRKDFVEQMLGEGNMLTFRGNDRKQKLLRLHTSGDFYDSEYIEKWIEIATQSPDWMIFGYTKSWRIKSLLPKLNELKSLPNVSLFASTDNTSGKPPNNWREAAIVGMEQRKERKGERFLTCPEQRGTRKSCLTCGFCWRAPKGNVRFIVH